MNLEFIKTTGVVLRHKPTGEGDAVITVLTSDMGVITAFVKGAKNYKNKNSVGTRAYAYSEFVLAMGRDMYKVRSSVLIESFYNLSTNIERVAYAGYIADLVRLSIPEDNVEGELLSLVLNTFYLLANSDKNLRIVKCVFELKLLCFLGLCPELTSCVKCARTDELSSISAKDGGVLCRFCSSEKNLSASAMSAMRYITQALPSKAFSFDMTEGVLCEFEAIIEKFMNEYIERDFYSKTYLNKIIGK